MQNTAHIYSELPDRDTMGGRLSRARDSAGLTIAELARRLGVKASTIQAWESDRSQPRANRLAMLAGVLNVSLSWLLHGVGASPADESRSDLVQAVSTNLQRLQRLHEETASIIAQIERDLARAANLE
ncbi:helix-turn-helix domain-containing protein [Chelativorans sp. YIM 93263]|uniref:helix-turn-helix domain-containing protein n=1 Tax=Chelativorans sp. YIM 93263 TaxID=2906648 RepID=UPI0023787D53|nr:helix-turn-helix transcriptional regulator [Chelativorans sp. YIM 93263]